jgi:uncharacterized membrane protein
LPAIVGWNWHQRQQRPDRSDEVWARVGAIDDLYSMTDTVQTLAMLHEYNVNLIIVGDLERAYYSPVGLGKFRTLADAGQLKILYDRDNTVIYQMVNN